MEQQVSISLPAPTVLECFFFKEELAHWSLKVTCMQHVKEALKGSVRLHVSVAVFSGITVQRTPSLKMEGHWLD